MALLCWTASSEQTARATTYEPIAPPVRFEEREYFVRCASGAVQSRLPKTRILVTPTINYTNVPTLQTALSEAFVRVAGDLSLEAYPQADGFNLAAADPKLYDYVMRGEVSIVDRAVTTEELKREFGVAFGGGKWGSFVGVPSTERWSVGWVTTTVNIYRTAVRQDSTGQLRTAMALAASASARGAFFTLGNADGVNASVVITYGREIAVEKQAGIQRAAITAMRASASRAVLVLAGVRPELCFL
ncbi:hypothetical protein D621_07485 [beta proteobacterium AAP51]|nr:hypothetical protein D621_07485 [beta proteobacterium AAP51]